MKIVFPDSQEIVVLDINENINEKDVEEKKTISISIDATGNEETIQSVRDKFAKEGNLTEIKVVTEDGTEHTKSNLRLIAVSEFISDERHNYSVRLAYNK